jgi:hypothetical protein
MSRRGHAMHFAGPHIQSGIQRERAVAIVFETVALGAPRRKRQHRIKTVQRLNRGLLVHAKYRSMLRRIHVQTDDIGDLFLKARIVGGHVPSILTGGVNLDGATVVASTSRGR